MLTENRSNLTVGSHIIIEPTLIKNDDQSGMPAKQQVIFEKLY